jgi:DNA-binding response OmpR family regulator
MEKKTVLIIDDDHNVVRDIKDFLELEQLGYKVISAFDGETGLKRAQEIKPDLILLDLVLPGHSGFKIAQEIKALPECVNIPIIAISLKREDIDKHVALKSGAAEYIEKPIDHDKLLFHLQDILGK